MELVVNKPDIVYPENTRTTAINTGKIITCSLFDI